MNPSPSSMIPLCFISSGNLPRIEHPALRTHCTLPVGSSCYSIRQLLLAYLQVEYGKDLIAAVEGIYTSPNRCCQTTQFPPCVPARFQPSPLPDCGHGAFVCFQSLACSKSSATFPNEWATGFSEHGHSLSALPSSQLFRGLGICESDRNMASALSRSITTLSRLGLNLNVVSAPVTSILCSLTMHKLFS